MPAARRSPSWVDDTSIDDTSLELTCDELRDLCEVAAHQKYGVAVRISVTPRSSLSIAEVLPKNAGIRWLPRSEPAKAIAANARDSLEALWHKLKRE